MRDKRPNPKNYISLKNAGNEEVQPQSKEKWSSTFVLLEAKQLAMISVVALLSALLYVTSGFGQFGTIVSPEVLDACPGYNATNVHTTHNGLSADLVLAGKACNVFGNDTQRLSLKVTYETDTRIHVKISDPSTKRYEVPDSVFSRPSHDGSASKSTAQIHFNYTTSPFSFSILRSQTKEVLFSTGSHPIIFEPQYLRLMTDLPSNANIYGLGEHTDPFRLPNYNTTRTMWSRDAYGVPEFTNLYSNHPVYFEHRTTGTHAVFLLSSNGLDVKINKTEANNQTSLEYNVNGGIFDLYFLAGSTSDPTEVAKQYAEVVGTPAEVPYWSFGLHQCRYGYTDFVDVADVITNYSSAGIPLETMWTDIDYMYKRWIFTNDPDYFPTARMREIVDYLHSHDQQYIMMTDPAVAYQPGGSYGTFNRGVAKDVFLKSSNGSLSLGVVWPGVTVFPDWFHPSIQDFWNNEYATFFNAETGIDIDGAWIDMNDPSSFCDYPCTDPFGAAATQGMPPNRTTLPPDPNTPIFGKQSNTNKRLLFEREQKRQAEKALFEKKATSGSYSRSRSTRSTPVVGHDGDNLLNPPYNINNANPTLSDRTAQVDIVQANGLVMYDTHNLYGTMMSTATRNAMINRRPGLRPFVITRSTFAGAGKYVGKWLGDNLSDWEHYRNSIAGILGMATINQIPMVGADICGFGGNTTETLCARWAMLGAFYPFMRNHDDIAGISQEFYRWPTVAQAAKNALDIRYRLLDYIYTAFHCQHTDGTPILNPLWFKYPTDANTFGIDLQFFFGDSILVSPVTQENVTNVDIYLPKDIFYDFLTFAPVQGQGQTVSLTNVSYESIPVHIRGGAVLPLRAESAMTTKALRTKDFELVVAPNVNGTAWGSLYFDDGVSLTQQSSTTVNLNFANGKLKVEGQYGAALGVKVASVAFLNVETAPKKVKLNGRPVASSQISYDSTSKVLKVNLGLDFDSSFEVSYQ